MAKGTTVRGNRGRLVSMSVEDFQTQVKGGQTPKDVLLRKPYIAESIKQVDGEPDSRKIQFTISTATPDRSRDSVSVDGWRMDNYRKNPVVLWAHEYWSLPVGRSTELAVLNSKLVSIAQFAPKDLYPFADTVYQMLLQKFLNSVSVGFQPLRYAYNEERGGLDFMEHDLLEYSVVPVPANPEALVEARSAGIDVEPIKAWAERILDDWHEEQGIWLPKSQVERVFQIISSDKTVSIPALVEAKCSTCGTKVEGVPPAETSGAKVWCQPCAAKSEVRAARGKLALKDVLKLCKGHISCPGPGGTHAGEACPMVDPNLAVENCPANASESCPMNGDNLFEDPGAPAIPPATNQPMASADPGVLAAFTESLNKLAASVEALKAVPIPPAATKTAEALLQEAVAVAKADITKAGRVLSKKNEDRLRSAVQALSDVLAQLDKQPDEDAPTDEKAADAPPPADVVIELADEETFDLDAKEVADLISSQVSEAMSEAIMRLTGRVS